MGLCAVKALFRFGISPNLTLCAFMPSLSAALWGVLVVTVGGITAEIILPAPAKVQRSAVIMPGGEFCWGVMRKGGYNANA